jgi:hypothetical protein
MFNIKRIVGQATLQVKKNLITAGYGIFSFG